MKEQTNIYVKQQVSYENNRWPNAHLWNVEEPRKHCHKHVFGEVGSVVHKTLEQFNGINGRSSCYNFDTPGTDTWQPTRLENLWTVDCSDSTEAFGSPIMRELYRQANGNVFVYPTRSVPRLWNRLLGSSTWTSFYKRILYHHTLKRPDDNAHVYHVHGFSFRHVLYCCH